jgi:hypothetical protein
MIKDFKRYVVLVLIVALLVLIIKTFTGCGTFRYSKTVTVEKTKKP